MHKQFKRHITPFPELVSKGWTIMQASSPFEGSTDIGNTRMVVPMEDDPISDYIRVHEFMHAQMSPADLPAFMREHDLPSVDNVQAAEDLRITVMLQCLNNARSRALLTTKVISTSPTMLQGFVQASRRLNDPDQLMFWARLIVGTIGTADEHPVWALTQRLPYVAMREALERLDNVLQSLVSDTRGHKPTLDFTVEVTRILDNVLQDEPMEGPQAYSPAGKQRYCTDGDNQWAEMSLERPPLSTTPRSLLRASTRRMTDEGVRLRSLHRLCTDRRVFSTRKPRAGGTVLIDVSGSMSLTHADLVQLVERAPASTVAIYEGNPYTNLGYVRIVAKDGKMVHPDAIKSEDHTRSGGGNMVDGPALQWLGTQVLPRIWLCDGMVTGCGDSESPNLTAEAKALQKRYAIERVNDVDAALERFATVRKTLR